MSGAWKQRERDVAEWFNSKRNPLSGRNNVADDGSRRLGDVVYNHAVIEVKRRKNNSAVTRAKATRELSGKSRKPWVHIEFSTGQPGLVSFVFDFDTARHVAKALMSLWESPIVVSQAQQGQQPPPSWTNDQDQAHLSRRQG